MAIIVEDGTGVVGANAYTTTSFVDSYFSDRGISTWVGTTQQKEYAIIKATDYIETIYSNKFMGNKEFPSNPQGLSFPRVNIYDKNGDAISGVALNLKKACAEYSLRALSSSLLPDPTVDSAGLIIESTRKVVGPLEQESKYKTQGAVPVYIKPYPQADYLLSEFLTQSGKAVR